MFKLLLACEEAVSEVFAFGLHSLVITQAKAFEWFFHGSSTLSFRDYSLRKASCQSQNWLTTSRRDARHCSK
eukprot:4655844-Amphidinium_carterae.2